jgi:hypothetical protein
MENLEVEDVGTEAAAMEEDPAIHNGTTPKSPRNAKEIRRITLTSLVSDAEKRDISQLIVPKRTKPLHR